MDWIWWSSAGVAGAAALAMLRWAVFGDGYPRLRRCPKCAYDLSRTTALECPECGKRPRKERAFFGRRRRWRAVLLSVLLVFAAIILAATPTVRRDGWARHVPGALLVRLPFDAEALLLGWSGEGAAPTGAVPIEVLRRMRAREFSTHAGDVLLDRFERAIESLGRGLSGEERRLARRVETLTVQMPHDEPLAVVIGRVLGVPVTTTYEPVETYGFEDRPPLPVDELIAHAYGYGAHLEMSGGGLDILDFNQSPTRYAVVRFRDVELPGSEIAELLVEYVDASTWRQYGGSPGCMTALGSGCLARQTPRNLARVLDLLARLRSDGDRAERIDLVSDALWPKSRDTDDWLVRRYIETRVYRIDPGQADAIAATIYTRTDPDQWYAYGGDESGMTATGSYLVVRTTRANHAIIAKIVRE